MNPKEGSRKGIQDFAVKGNISPCRQKIALLIAVLFFFFQANAQMSDTLKGVEIIKRKEQPASADVKLRQYTPGQKLISIDSTTMQVYQQQTLANLLSQQVPVFVKSYGFNNLATLNFRGSSAAQSQVLWNGIPLANASLGIADVSLLPVSLMDKINVVYGSSSAMFGSGNVGGAVMLENGLPAADSTAKKMMQLSLGVGSFQQYQVGLKTSYNSRKWFLSLNAFGQTATNDFSYINQNGAEKKMENSRLKGGGVLIQSAYRIAAENTLSLTVWYQNFYREIPPALFESYSVKQQKDASLRVLLDWKKKTGSSLFYSKLAFLKDEMHFEDSLIGMKTSNPTSQVYGEIGLEKKVGAHHSLMIFVPASYAMMSGKEDNSQTKLALAAAWRSKFFNERLQFAINAREEMVNEKSFFLSGINAGYQLNDWLKFRANVQKTYRVPTLNELYYSPGGNKDLKPETGWNEDAGYAVNVKWKAFTFRHDVSFFNRNINDWIIWFGGSIWTPHNIASVNSRGVETENNILWQVGKCKFHVGLNSSYVLATTVSSYVPNDGSIGKQIPYTPRYQMQGNIGLTWKNFYLNYNHNYTGVRYFTTDESSSIDAYSVGNIQLLTTLSRQKIRFCIQLNNVWQEKYQVVANRPMPGLNWQAGLHYLL